MNPITPGHQLPTASASPTPRPLSSGIDYQPDPSLLTIRIQGELLTISSVDLAQGLGVRHKNLLETIRAHQPIIETHFSLVAFETEAVKNAGKRGTKFKSLVYLTEDQAMFIGTLSRNTSQVVIFKAMLVKSFAQARRQLQANQSIRYPTDTLTQYWQNDQRLNQIEQQLTEFLNRQQQAATALLALPRSTEPVPEETTRAKVQRIINAYCQAKSLSQQEVWRKVYDRLYYAYRISIRRHKKRSERESWLDVAERCGHMDKLFAIVSQELVLG